MVVQFHCRDSDGKTLTFIDEHTYEAVHRQRKKVKKGNNIFTTIKHIKTCIMEKFPYRTKKLLWTPTVVLSQALKKSMDTQTPIIFMHAIAFTMKTIHIPKTSRSNILTDNE